MARTAIVDPPDPLPLIHPERITKWHNEVWIAERFLLLAGYENVGTGMIIRVARKEGGKEHFFEIDGPARQKGVTTTEDGWWLQRVDPEDVFKDLVITGVDDAR